MKLLPKPATIEIKLYQDRGKEGAVFAAWCNNLAAPRFLKQRNGKITWHTFDVYTIEDKDSMIPLDISVNVPYEELAIKKALAKLGVKIALKYGAFVLDINGVTEWQNKEFFKLNI